MPQIDVRRNLQISVVGQLTRIFFIFFIFFGLFYFYNINLSIENLDPIEHLYDFLVDPLPLVEEKKIVTECEALKDTAISLIGFGIGFGIVFVGFVMLEYLFK